MRGIEREERKRGGGREVRGRGKGESSVHEEGERRWGGRERRERGREERGRERVLGQRSLSWGRSWPRWWR